jgi:hypothetical protein
MLEMPGMWTVCQEKPQAASVTSSREAMWAASGVIEVGCPSLLDIIS